MTRPRLTELGGRRAPALHRTLPTWARERKPGGELTYRLYVPHRFGGALWSSVSFGADVDRQEAAAALRGLRGVLWGHDKARGEAAMAVQAVAAPEAPGPQAEPPTVEQSPPEIEQPEGPQQSLF